MTKIETRRLCSAVVMQELMHRRWFGGKFQGDANRYIPPLLAAVWLWSKLGKHLSLMEAFDCMQVRHGKTGNRYIGIAEKMGLLERSEKSKADGRRTELRATEKLDGEMKQEMSRLTATLADALEALDVRTDPAKEANRHLQTVAALQTLPTAGWSPLAATLNSYESHGRT